MSAPNPFAPPQADSAPRPPGEVRLYSPGALLGFTILFSPLVGGALAAVNWSRLGEHARARTTLLLCYAPSLIFMVVAGRAAEKHIDILRLPALMLSIGLGSWLRSSFVEPYQKHLEVGGAKGSLLWAAVVSLALLCGLIVLIALLIAAKGAP